jgi:hypothetical protein
MTNKFKRSLIAVAVLCSMPTGYRRAGFGLEQGENLLDVNLEQFEKLAADKNLTVTAVDTELTQTPEDKSHSNLSLEEENTAFKAEIISLSNQITELQKQLATVQVVNHEDTAGLAGTVVIVEGEHGKTTEIDVSSAPEELHHWIAVIDDLNKEAPLTKKPNCDHLTISVDDESVTPSAAERDAAWDWYQNNIVIASSKAVDTDAEA